MAVKQPTRGGKNGEGQGMPVVSHYRLHEERTEAQGLRLSVVVVYVRQGRKGRVSDPAKRAAPPPLPYSSAERG